MMDYPDFAVSLYEHVHKFIDSLDDNHEALVLVSDIIVHEFSIDKSGFIIFYGERNGLPAQIIQSYETINISLLSVEVFEDRPKRDFIFGFHPSNNN